MKTVIQHYYAIIDKKICAITFSKLWTAIQQKLGAPYLNLKLEQLCTTKRNQLLFLLPKHLRKGKATVLSIQLTNSKIEELREVIELSGVQLLKLVRVPLTMKEQELFIPPDVMRDLI